MQGAGILKNLHLVLKGRVHGSAHVHESILLFFKAKKLIRKRKKHLDSCTCAEM